MHYFKTKIKKIYIITLIILIFTILIEIFLRATSYILINSRYKKPISNSNIIVCLGDSYTFGGEVEPNETYPYLLNLLVKNKNYEVINAGICEADTQKILDRFKEINHSYNYNKVIFLGGTANFFSYKSEEKIFAKFKITKLFNFFLTNLNFLITKQKIKTSIENSLPVKLDEKLKEIINSDDYFVNLIIKHLFEQRNFKEAEKIFIQAIKKYPENINLNYLGINLYFKIGNLEKSNFYKNQLNKIFLKNCTLNKTELCGRIKRILGEWEIINNNFEKGTKSLLESLYYVSEINEYDVYVIKQAFSLQSSISTEEILKKLLEIKNKNKYLSKSKKLNDLINYFHYFDTNEQLINNKIKSDIKEIKKIIQKNNAELYILTYPYPYKKINKLLREIAKEEDINLIDTEKYFTTLYENERKKYFKDFDHLTLEGNKILAKLIYENIFK